MENGNGTLVQMENGNGTLLTEIENGNVNFLLRWTMEMSTWDGKWKMELLAEMENGTC